MPTLEIYNLLCNCILFFLEASPGMVAYADEAEDSSEDTVEGEDDDEAIVETDEGGPETGTDAATTEQKVGE